jgi:hypothetical protein
MQNQLSSSSLHKLVSQVISTQLPVSVRRRSFFINDIQPGFFVAIHPQLLASVISDILQLVIKSTSHKCIRISAQAYGPLALITLKDKNGLFQYGSIKELQPIQILASRLGGAISTTYQPKEGSTIVISFSNLVSQYPPTWPGKTIHDTQSIKA